MTRVLVVYGSRHGGTRGIAERIGDVLRTEGLEATVEAADRATVDGIDAFVLGSGVYMGRWLKEPIRFIERHQAVLSERPLWLFSSGPLGGPGDGTARGPVEDALGPVSGPGSAGRRQITELAEATGARENHVFAGAFDPDDPPQTIAERLVRLMPMSKGILPAGDFRDWESIEAWAHEIAEALATTGIDPSMDQPRSTRPAPIMLTPDQPRGNASM